MISLDSLVRIETFQWVTLEFPERIFPAPFPGVEARGDGRAVEAMREPGVFMAASLPWFLIFFKQLSSERFPLGRFSPKPTHSQASEAQFERLVLVRPNWPQPNLSAQLMISTSTLAVAILASHVARPGVLTGSTQASQTAFISS